jgi:serine/threonine-protein kinase
VSKSDAAVLLQLAESIADGSPIDWEQAEADASAEDKPVVRQLRVLSNLAVLHRSMPAESMKTVGAAVVRRESARPAIGSWAHLTLMERLGGGAFGDVYRAWDRHLEREVALKLLRVDVPDDDLASSRIANEGRLLARIRHQNVITVHGVGAHENRVGLWMELVRGATLEQQLAAHGPFSAREAAAIGIDLCRALAAIHAAGLIHRDVKAQNVMREDGGRIVLMDLGTGREADRTTARCAPELAGTPLYLAPEIYVGSPASARTDLYSLGVLLYHLVTGSFPVRAATFDELQKAHARGEFVRLRDARADLPTAFVRVVDRAIAPEPVKRYATAGEFEADLADAVAEPAKKEVYARHRTPWFGRLRTWPGLALAAAAVIAVVATLVPSWSKPAARPATPIRSVAVLPLINLSGDQSQDYLADGMTDELIGRLGRLGSIQVISRTSVMPFKGSTKSIPEIAKMLNVDAVLEGSVLTVASDGGDSRARRVRINARLIHAGADTQLWDRTFEAVLADAIALQGEVAKAVADGINVRLTNAGQVRPVNPQAYDAYLRARYLWNKRTLPDARKAIDGFKVAVDADPTSALAWSGLADGYIVLASYDADRPRSARTLAKAAAAKALEFDSSLAEAHAALGNVAWTYDWDAATAEREFKQALALNPNYATAHGWYGLYLNEVGRFAEALTEMRRAQALDPLVLVHEANVGRSFYFARQFDQSVEAFQNLVRRESNYWIGHALLGQTYLAQNRYADAIRELERARRLSPETPRNLGVLGDAYGRAGRRRDAQALADQLARLGQSQYVSPVYTAMIRSGLGDNRGAIAALEQALADRSDWMILLNVDPAFDPLRNEPAFRDLLQRVQNPSPAADAP